MTTDIASQLLQTHYGFKANLTRLAGDRDANFQAQIADGRRFVFKIMHPDCSEDNVALQCAALSHLADCPIGLPRVINTLNGAQWTSVELTDGSHFLWLLSWCPGTLLAQHSPHGTLIYSSFGELLGRLCNALAGFDHPASREGSRWNLTRALDVASYIDDIQGDSRQLAQAIFYTFRARTLAALKDLPQGVIHNDANDYNVLVNDHKGEARVDGIFDFGDLAWQPLVCDIAIALAYLILDKPDPLDVCASFLSGYSRQRRPHPREMTVLLDLIKTRLAVSVAISSHRQLEEPDDPYIVISQRPAIAALRQLDLIPESEAERVFREACGLG